MPDLASVTISPILVAELLVENGRMPVNVHLIDHPDGRILVDTGMTVLHDAVADMDPILTPLTEHPIDLSTIDLVVNTHLHFDHCGGNHLFAGLPIHVQRQELTDALNEDEYTIREWVRAPGVEYVQHEGDFELLPGVRVIATPGHTPGSQVVVVDLEDGPVVIAGDTAVWFGQLDEPENDAQRQVLALNPVAVWLSHTNEPWRPPAR
ncbi:MAG: N-acyl homoserine lactonase family protein [Pseudolysinimonas sp.]